MLQYLSLAVLVGAISAAEILLPNTLCAQRNEYMPKRESCDSYIECKDYVASEMLCPDGLHFNPTAPWPSYPCSYPQDFSCEGRGVPQPAKPTADCPHQYGFYPSPLAGPGNCGQYRMCVEGVAIEMMCSPGLAFNPDSARCDWPDLVPFCKAEGYAQFGNQYQSNSAFGNPRIGQQSTRPQQSAFGAQNQRQNQQSQYQQNQYQQNQQQQNPQQQSARQSAGSCSELNERSPVSGSCDRYIECINGTAEEKLCPDGLLFNPNANGYPCQYPNEVQCLERSSLQPPQPTEECPHQFGYFKLGDAKNCSGFRNCVNGMAYDLVCPEGLAWSSESYRCDWPDTVADCDAEAFLGFRCPEVPELKGFGPPAGYRFYRSDINCQKYFICIEGRPRALACGGDSAFDELTSTCVSADEVSACPTELRAAAAESRELEQQRLAKQIQVDALPQKLKRRQF